MCINIARIVVKISDAGYKFALLSRRAIDRPSDKQAAHVQRMPMPSVDIVQ